MTRKKPPDKPGPKRYDEATVARALELYQTVGLAGAARETGATKQAIRRWAARAGVIPAEQAAAVAAQTAAATARAQEEMARRIAEGRAALIPKLVQVANDALDAEMTILAALRRTQRAALDNEHGLVSGGLMAQLGAVLAGPRVREIVGARTRAIHDLQLLTGEETERGTAGQVTVVFATAPAPLDRPAPTVIDLQPDPRAIGSS